MVLWDLSMLGSVRVALWASSEGWLAGTCAWALLSVEGGNLAWVWALRAEGWGGLVAEISPGFPERGRGGCPPPTLPGLPAVSGLRGHYGSERPCGPSRLMRCGPRLE